LNRITPLKQRWKIRRTNIYTKGEDQTDTYIYYKIEQLDSTKAKGEDRTDIYIYKGGRSDGHIYILRGKIRRTHIYYKIEQQASTKTKGEDQTDTYIL
jgi:hypothetical protein